MKRTKVFKDLKEKLKKLTSTDDPDLDAATEDIIHLVKPPKERSATRRADGTGSVYKLSGRRRKPWAAAITDGYIDGAQNREIIGTYVTKADAENALAQHSLAPTSQKRKYTLEQVYKLVQKNHFENLSPKTIESYDLSYRRLEHLSKKTFADLRTVHYQRVIDNNGDLSLSMLSKIKTTVGLLYKYAYAADIVHKDYSTAIRLPKREKKRKTEIFTDSEITTLFKHDHIPYVDTVLMYIFTGARPSELLLLKKENIDIERMLISGGIKTDAGKDRIIPIHTAIQKYVVNRYNASDQYLIEREVERGRAGSKYTKRIPLSYTYYCRKCYYPALEAAGVPRRTPHVGRHTFTSNAYRYNKGQDDKSIIEILGHTDVAFSKNVYDHPNIDRLREAVENVRVPE